MEKQKKEIVSFVKERTFGDIIGAPFHFIIQEFKFFAGTLLKYAGPFVAIMFLTFALLGNDIYNAVLMNSNVPNSTIVYGIILLLSLLLGYMAVILVTHSYITLYVKKGKGNFTREDVGDLLKKNVWKVFGVGFLTASITGVGFLLFYIPGIYLGIALSFVFLIIIYENLSAGKAISRSFDVIKGKWWQTFALILVFGMIVGMTSYIFIIPIYVIIFAAAISGTQIGSGSVIIIILFVFLYFTVYLFFMSMQQIMIAFQYFNIRTGKDGLILKDRIAAINNDDKSDNSSDKDKKSEEKNDFSELSDEKTQEEKNRFTEEGDDINRFKPKE